MLLTMLYAGLRVKECAALRYDHQPSDPAPDPLAEPVDHSGKIEKSRHDTSGWLRKPVGLPIRRFADRSVAGQTLPNVRKPDGMDFAPIQVNI